MKKYLLTTLAVLSFVFSLGQITFEKTFGGAGDDYGTSIKQTLDGGYVISGSFYNSNHTIIKTDSLGEIEWTKNYPFLDSLTSYYSFKSIIQTRDSNYVLIGQINNGSFLLNVNSTGEVLFFSKHTEFNNVSISFNQVVEDMEGYLIIVGSYDLIDSWECCGSLFWKILDFNDSSITISSPNIYCSGDYGCSLTDIIIDNEGNYLIIGNSYEPEPKPWLAKLSPTLETLFDMEYSFPFIASSITQEQEGSYLIVGDDYNDDIDSTEVYKTDNEGNLHWRKKYKEDESSWKGNDIVTTNDGYLISGGEMDFNLMKIDLNYNLLWYRKYGGTSQDRIYKMEATNDGGCVMIGSTQSYSVGGRDIYFIKTNAQGLVLGINDIKRTESTLIAPNPFSVKATLKTETFLKNAVFTVYNYQGQIVDRMENINGHSFDYDRGNITEGLYLFQLQMNNEIISSGKFVIKDFQ